MLTKFEFSRRIFEKYSNIKFHENPSNGIRVVPCERDGRTDGHTDMTKQTIAFRNFAIVRKMNNTSLYLCVNF
jgi:hypothetical protein